MSSESPAGSADIFTGFRSSHPMENTYEMTPKSLEKVNFSDFGSKISSFFAHINFIVQQSTGWYFKLSGGNFISYTFSMNCKKYFHFVVKLLIKNIMLIWPLTFYLYVFFSCVNVYFKELLYYSGYYSGIKNTEGISS